MHPQRLRELFDELSAALVLFARQWCDDPDDAVQEAFVDLAACQPEPESPPAWLYTTTRRKAQNIARAAARRRQHHRRAVQGKSTAPSSWFEGATGDFPLSPQQVSEGLELLPAQQRELVVARVWGGLTFEQLADVSGCSVSSVYRRYAAALRNLKQILGRLAEEQTIPDQAEPHGPAGENFQADRGCQPPESPPLLTHSHKLARANNKHSDLNHNDVENDYLHDHDQHHHRTAKAIHRIRLADGESP